MTTGSQHAGTWSALRPVAALLAGVFLASAGTGPLTTLISLRLEADAAGRLAIGAVMAAYFLGLTLGSLLAYRVVLRAGHIRAFSAFVSVLSAAALAYPLVGHPMAWAGLRLGEGFCMAGVFICVESWLNDRAEPARRGSVLALYMSCLYLGQASGQFLLGLDEGPGGYRVFLLVSMLLSLAVLPVSLTRMAPPPLPAVASLPARRLIAASPLGVVGVVASGLVLGALYALGPVFARDGAGFDTAGAARFMSVLIAGGVVLQWPLGRLSDAFDRRRVIIGTLAGLTLAAAALPLLARQGEWALLGGAALFGGFAFALYPLCVAHTNDHLAAEDRIGGSGGLVLAYSAGATLGPLLASAAMAGFGAAGLFGFATAVGAAALGFGLWRLAARGPVPAERQGRFQALPQTTPAAVALNPRAAPGD
ncbi:MFS transporter [Paeniroseomonas aquatica]|uniref:MFS transporter n=1 Tax=Paeniroseomonas aquatica TaxID=373043 RepID=A0ABT8AC94_9PROT|nr:MFS transporter [Paeniroseomonas aquatica]MDN3567303.1 MFS transporter [Paeniroseomonas aquatica]